MSAGCTALPGTPVRTGVASWLLCHRAGAQQADIALVLVSAMNEGVAAAGRIASVVTPGRRCDWDNSSASPWWPLHFRRCARKSDCRQQAERPPRPERLPVRRPSVSSPPKRVSMSTPWVSIRCLVRGGSLSRCSRRLGAKEKISVDGAQGRYKSERRRALWRTTSIEVAMFSVSTWAPRYMRS